MEAAADEEEPLDLLEEDLIATLAPLASSRSPPNVPKGLPCEEKLSTGESRMLFDTLYLTKRLIFLCYCVDRVFS